MHSLGGPAAALPGDGLEQRVSRLALYIFDPGIWYMTNIHSTNFFLVNDTGPTIYFNFDVTHFFDPIFRIRTPFSPS